MSRRALHALVILLAFSATLTLAVPALAAPPPEPVCSNCEPAYERAAADAGVDVRVAESGAVVSIDDDGNATWRVGLVLDGPDAEELAQNGSLHRQVAAEAVGDGFVEAGPGRGLNRIGGGGPTFSDADHVRYYRFRDPEFARDTVGGAVVVTKFRSDLQRANYAGLGVDRLTVHSFLDVTHALPGTDTLDGLEGSSFTLTERHTGLATFEPNTGVVGHANYIPSIIGLAAVLLPVVAENAAIVVLPALAVHALVTGGLFALLSGSFPEPGQREHRAVVGILAATAAVLALQPLLAPLLGAPVFGDAEPLLLGPAAAFAVVATGLVCPSLVGGEGSPKSLALRALGVGAVGGGVAGIVAPGTTGWTFAMWALDSTQAGATAWDGLGFALMTTGPTLALLPAGAALAEGRTRGALGVALAGAVLGWVASPVLYFAQTGLIVPGFVLGFPAVSAVLLLGAPLLLAGWVLGADHAPGFDDH